MKYTLDLFNDNSERIPYNRPDMPIYIGRGQLSNFVNLSASGHWHDDIEFSVILNGQMSYNINGTIHTVKQGEGVFINSRQFHSHYSENNTDCEYICVLLHPVLLCANQYLEKNCVVPILSNNAFPYTILHEDGSWKADLIADVRHIYDLCGTAERACEIMIQSLFFRIWSILFSNMPDTIQPASGSGNRLTALRDMIGFLQKNYGEKITLSDIATAGNVCPSNCCIIFNEYLHQAPIQYLITYRLNKSAELLKNTSMSITEIALESGFTGVSYFAETFRKHFGRSPTQYRKWVDA